MDLRFTDTNAADDAAGRAFGLEGNLYLPVVIAAVGGLGMLAGLGLGLGVSWGIAGVVAGLPVAGVVAWILVLRRGQPRGHDRDQVEAWLGKKHFEVGKGGRA